MELGRTLRPVGFSLALIPPASEGSEPRLHGRKVAFENVFENDNICRPTSLTKRSIAFRSLCWHTRNQSQVARVRSWGDRRYRRETSLARASICHEVREEPAGRVASFRSETA